MSIHHLAFRETARGGGTPSGGVAALRSAGPPVSPPAPLPLQAGGAGLATPARARELRLRALVDNYTDFLARVLRNAGISHADVDDEVQRTFIIVARRLDEVRLGSEKSFLLQTALHLAAHARRSMARRREVRADEAPEQIDTLATPEQLTDQKRSRQMLDRVLDQMDGSLRTVFVLYEFEEMSMSEIAGVLEIPAGTVASRLRRARVDFRERVSVIEGVLNARVKP